MDLLRELVKNNLVFEGVEVEQLGSVEWVLSLPLGEVEGGVYKGGYWGDAVVTGFPATLRLQVGDLYDEGEFVIGEGKVILDMPDGQKEVGICLLYTSPSPRD